MLTKDDLAGSPYSLPMNEVSVASNVSIAMKWWPRRNMVVCALCADVAKSLLLHTEEITLEHRTPSAPLSDVADQLLAYPENSGHVISSSQ